MIHSMANTQRPLSTEELRVTKAWYYMGMEFLAAARVLRQTQGGIAKAAHAPDSSEAGLSAKLSSGLAIMVCLAYGTEALLKGLGKVAGIEPEKTHDQLELIDHIANKERLFPFREVAEQLGAWTKDLRYPAETGINEGWLVKPERGETAWEYACALQQLLMGKLKDNGAELEQWNLASVDQPLMGIST